MKLKLYINSASTFTALQMFDFVACASDFNTIKIVSWYRTPLASDALKKINAVNTLYFSQISHLSKEYIARISNVIDKYNPEDVEVHANIYFSHVESWRLLSALVKKYSCNKIRLHLYDDGAAGVNERTRLNQLSEKEYLLESAKNKADLLSHVFEVEDPFLPEYSVRWPSLRHYCWHHIVETTYHILGDKFTCYNGVISPFMEDISPYCQVFDFGIISPKKMAACLCLLNIDYNQFIYLRKEMLAPDAVVFTGTGNFQREYDNGCADRVINKINSLKDKGVIDKGSRVIFKPHPINHPDNINRIAKHIGDDVFVVPASIPFEFFVMAGIIPNNIIGVFSTLMLLVPKENIKYVIFDAKDHNEAMKNPMLLNLINNNLIEESKVFGWTD